MSNLDIFVEEARKVSEWYQSFEEDPEKIEGPGSIIGMEFWDGGDDIDYINSAILGFEEYYRVFESGQDYLNYFKSAGYLTKDSSKEWKEKIVNLSRLFDKLTDGERNSILDYFPEYGDSEDWGDEDEEAYESSGDEEPAKIAFIDVSGSNQSPKRLNYSERLAREAGAKDFLYFSGHISENRGDSSSGTRYDIIQDYMDKNNIKSAIVVTDDDIEGSPGGQKIKQDPRVHLINMVDRVGRENYDRGFIPGDDVEREIAEAMGYRPSKKF